MSFEGYEVSVPEGLSELLNRAGAWKYIEQEENENEENSLDDNDRKVVMENRQLKTYLTYKGKRK